MIYRLLLSSLLLWLLDEVLPDCRERRKHSQPLTETNSSANIKYISSYSGGGSVSSRLHFLTPSSLACADITEYDCGACWESFALLLVMLLPAQIRSFLPVLLFSATLERFWSLHYSKTRQRHSTSIKNWEVQILRQSVCHQQPGCVQSPLKLASLPITISVFNVSKSPSLHFSPNGPGSALQGGSRPLVCECVFGCVCERVNERPLESTLCTVKVL